MQPQSNFLFLPHFSTRGALRKKRNSLGLSVTWQQLNVYPFFCQADGMDSGELIANSHSKDFPPI